MQRTINATILNTGAAGDFSAQPWVYNTISGSGCSLTGTGGFSITPTNFSLGAGASTNLSWNFDDASLPAGTNYATLKVFGGSGATISTFGTSTGSSVNYLSIYNYLRGVKASCPAIGTATKITAFLYNPATATKTCKCALYKASDSSFVAQTNEVVVPANNNAWVDFTFAVPPTITAQDYILVAFGYVGSGNYVGLCYATGSGVSRAASGTYPTFPNPATFSSGSTNHLIYCTYTPSASACQDGASASFNVGAQTGAIGGFITDFDTGAVLPGATVSLSPSSYATISQSDGSYLMTGITPGAYTFWVGKSGYTSMSGPVTILANTTLQVNASIRRIQPSIRNHGTGTGWSGWPNAGVTGAKTAFAAGETVYAMWVLDNVVAGQQSIIQWYWKDARGVWMWQWENAYTVPSTGSIYHYSYNVNMPTGEWKIRYVYGPLTVLEAEDYFTYG